MQSTPASFRAVAVWPGAAPKRRVSLAPMRPPCQVEADDLDQGPSGQISYSLAASQPARGLFHVDPATGTITTTAILDREIWAETR